MSFKSVRTSLPSAILEHLRQFERVVVREECEIKIVELVESVEGMRYFMEFLGDDEEVDPILTPNFGHPMYPYINPVIQIEVFNLLATYQPLAAADFLPGVVIPFVIAQFPIIGGGIQFHHAKIAIQAVQSEIQNLLIFNNNCPGLTSLPSGQVICDLSIFYANAVVVTRLSKF
jgi:hypothetical protein